MVLLGTMAGTQVTESSLLPWDVDAAAVNSTSQTSTQRLRKSRSLAHKDTLQVNGRAGAVQPHGLGHNDGAARFPSSASSTLLVPFKWQPLESSKSSDAVA